MAYPGVALVAMVGIGLGFALWYLFADNSHPNEGHQNYNGQPLRSSPSNDSWDLPNDARCRPRRSRTRATYDCAICTESMSGAVTETTCGHMFHPICIEKWQTESEGRVVGCPLCRRSI